MCRLVSILFALGMCLACSEAARAATTVECWRPGRRRDEVTLGARQDYSLRLGYRTDVPVRIWARPYFQGREVDAGSNPSPRYEGNGEALGWFFFMEPGTQVSPARGHSSQPPLPSQGEGPR